MKILRHLKRLKTDIALLQESHLPASDFHRMQKLWVGTVLGSEAAGRKAGVLLLIHKNLPCSILSTKTDHQGRLLTTHVKIGSKELIISNVYAPNSPNKQFYSELSSWLLENTHLPHLIGGDFNDTLHLIDDRSSPKSPNPRSTTPAPTLFANTMDSIHIQDLWRLSHPTDREFTFYSNPHNIFTRIDYFFGSDNLIPFLQNTTIHDITISDHAPIEVTLDNLNLPPHPNIWRFPSFLHNNTDFQQYMSDAWTEYSSNNAPHIHDPNLFWDAGKAYLRGRIISYATSFKRNTLSKYKAASSRLRQAQRALYTSDSPANRMEWQAAKRDFDTWVNTLEHTKQAHLEASLHKFGNKAGKLLSRLCKGPFRPTHITSLRDSTGTLQSTPQAINKVMQQFYSTLYATDPIDAQKARAFLGKTSLPKISTLQLETLNAPITPTEISTTIRHLTLSKAPGPDGFTSEFYKTLQPLLEPTLLQVYRNIWSGGSYLQSGNQALIKLLSKKGKDPQEPGSYRPISLLNLDVKILSKIIATRLADIVPSLIHPAQSGFVKGRTATLNIRKVMMALDHALHHPNTNHAIITLDAEKAFDNVSFDWLFMTMSEMGFSGPFHHLITAMYTAPSAKLVVAGLISEEFRLHKGTRQGCPLSPLLFNIALEPLSRYLTLTAPLHGIKIGTHDLLTSLFADDILIFSANPPSDMSTIKKVFDEFRLCSGLRINYSKSEILPIGTHSVPPWAQTSVFPVAKSHITYLGIKIGKLPSSIYHLNYPPLLSKISQELNAWMDLPLSLLGRCHLIKMVSFARLLYPLQTIPLLLLHKDVSLLNSSLSKFLWRNKRPRIALKKLYLPRREGGISLPHIRMYNIACLLRTSIDWITQSSRYSNFSLESDMAHPYSLAGLLHCRWKSVPPPHQHNLLLRDTAVAWREARKILKISPFMSSHLPIQGNPAFPQGLDHKPFKIWERKGLTKFSSLCNIQTGRPLPFTNIAESFALPISHSFHYGQCISFLKETCIQAEKRFPPNIIDQMISNNSYKTSDIYKPLLLKSSPPLSTSSIKNWSKDFPDSNLVEKIVQGLNSVQQLTPNEVWRETQLKISHRAYMPFSSSKTDASKAFCPLCHLRKPTLAHRFWSCSYISTFWDQALAYIFEVTLLKLPKDPLLLIFGYWDPLLLPWSKLANSDTSPSGNLKVNTPHKGWILTCLLIARRTILKHWISPPHPNIAQVKRELLHLLIKDRINTDFKQTTSSDRFHFKWHTFMLSSLSQEEIANMNKSTFSYQDSHQQLRNKI